MSADKPRLRFEADADRFIVDFTDHIDEHIRTVNAALTAGLEAATIELVVAHLRNRGYVISGPIEGSGDTERTEYRARYVTPQTPEGGYELTDAGASKANVRRDSYDLRRSEETHAGVIAWETRTVVQQPWSLEELTS